MEYWILCSKELLSQHNWQLPITQTTDFKNYDDAYIIIIIAVHLNNQAFSSSYQPYDINTYGPRIAWITGDIIAPENGRYMALLLRHLSEIVWLQRIPLGTQLIGNVPYPVSTLEKQEATSG